MPKANGAGLRVVAFVAANPGCTYAELCDGSGATRHGGLVSYMLKTGRIFMAGPHGWRRYYPAVEQAAAAHDWLVQQAADARREVKRRADVEQLRRRKALSRMLGKSRNTRPDRAVQGEPSASEFVVSGVRVKLARHAKAPTATVRALDPRECRPWAEAVA
jgi:hypothetical protein